MVHREVDVAGQRVEELRALNRVMAVVRACGVIFALVQILTFYRPYPPGGMRFALMAPLLIAVVGPVVMIGARRAVTVRALTAWSVGGLVLDATAVLVLVFAYTFDPETAVWALLYFIPIEGAMLFQLRGALGAMAVVSVGYVLREVYGAAVHGVPFLLVSVTYRLGLGVLMASVFGVTTKRLVDERDRLRQMSDLLARHDLDMAEAAEALRVARRAQLEFVAVTNHELRTPLTAIRGFARTLQHRWAAMDDESRQTAIAAIDTQSRRLGEMVEDVLMVAAMRTGSVAVSPRPLLLRQWLHEALELADVHAEVECADDVLVQADATRLLQILVNLLTNARKYGEQPITLSGHSDSGRTVITVADRGPGVPEDFRPRMYEEFTQASQGASRTAEGYGLGLAIVRYLTVALGGAITYRDRPGGGAVFELDLPTGETGETGDVDRPDAADRGAGSHLPEGPLNAAAGRPAAAGPPWPPAPMTAQPS